MAIAPPLELDVSNVQESLHMGNNPMEDIYIEYQAPMSNLTHDPAPVHQNSVLPGNVPAGPVVLSNSTKYLTHLLKLYFPECTNPTWKSPEQLKACKMAVTQVEIFIAVFFTGSSKSLFFTLPAVHEKNKKGVPYQTFVVIPTNALPYDQFQKVRNAGLNAIIWKAKGNNPPPNVQIVFIEMETALSQAFKTYVLFTLWALQVVYFDTKS
ncbi:hypothetical protein CPB84DRAFT_1852102 [Gymnopilus junonius]|uniref:Uncharacterized protein n=1 Tax=Gymnopilus junonius TaxID=109634 RepID=A0A9P5ND90_GYMJU|nr:hypothetical protein CPB84DRAFT_1852102 [Gymnopilus junonius]